jgi:hypothetical protein
VRPLAVLEPRHVVAGADVHRLRGQLVAELRANGVRLGDLLGHQAVALEHVVEVGVATEVQLAGAVQPHAAVHEEARQHAMHDGGADLGFHVVADDRQAAILEAAAPVRLARNEHRNAVHERAAGVEDLLDVPLGRHLAADGQIVDHHVGLGLAQDVGDVGGGAGRLLDHLRQIGAEAVVRHAAVDRHAEVRHRRELHGVVRRLPDRLRQVAADLALVDVEGGGELDVADVVTAEPRVHEAGDEGVVGRLAVILNSLDERRCAVADADDGDSNRSHGGLLKPREAMCGRV